MKPEEGGWVDKSGGGGGEMSREGAGKGPRGTLPVEMGGVRTALEAVDVTWMFV